MLVEALKSTLSLILSDSDFCPNIKSNVFKFIRRSKFSQLKSKVSFKSFNSSGFGGSVSVGVIGGVSVGVVEGVSVDRVGGGVSEGVIEGVSVGVGFSMEFLIICSTIELGIK
ncbi:hypothetical protein ES705_06025 [subsurface metagenome]